MSGNPDLIAGRIDRARLDGARFPALLELPVRFDELDVYSHVNNAAAVAMLQEARIAFYRQMALPRVGNDYRSVVVGMTVEYAGEISYPGTVQIHSGVSRLGSSSYTFAQVLRQNGAAAVYSLLTMVVTNGGAPCPIPGPLRTALETSCCLQFGVGGQG